MDGKQTVAVALAEQKKCIDHEGLVSDCQAAIGKATIAQARYAGMQAHAAVTGDIVGGLTLLAAVFAAIFAGKAAAHTRRGADAALAAVDEAKRMNAAAVRPHVAVEEANIAFDISNGCCPTIRLTTRNAGSFTALDWECQLLLRYRINGVEGERETPRHRWGNRGVRGVSLPPGDRSARIPISLTFPLNIAEQAALVSGVIQEGMAIDLVVFCRCFDVFGNAVEDKFHFGGVAFNLFGLLTDNPLGEEARVTLQHVPPGTRPLGEEDQLPG